MPYRYYQHEATDATFDYWSQQPGHPLIDMATGTGKSKTMSKLTKEMVQQYPDMRVMNCTHVIELVESNFKDMVHEWPFAPVGLYAASLNRRDAHAQILFAQLQTVWNKANEIGHVDVLVIDEVHLVPKDSNTMYRKLIDALMAINPDMKIVGFTATVYRLDSGRLDEGEDRLFDKVVYEYGIRKGIDDGYLTPITSKRVESMQNISGVGMRMGDFNRKALAEAVDVDELNKRILEEVLDTEGNRKTGIFFCAGIAHATHMRDLVRAAGRTCEVVSGKTPTGERRAILKALIGGEIWSVTNDNVLSTGTNIPNLDLLVDLAPTASAGRYVQRGGRLTRVIYPSGFDPESSDAEGRRAAIATGPKQSARYMNFAGNIERHGPLDAVEVRKPGDGKGEAPIKLCPTCEEILHASLRVCWACGHEFEFEEHSKLTERASDAPILSTNEPYWRTVTSRTFRRHEKMGGTPSVKCTYMLGLEAQAEWLCCEHKGFAKAKADRWWSKHNGKAPFPSDVDEFLERVAAGEIRETDEIQLRKNGRHYDVLDHRAGEAMPSVAAANDNERERLKAVVGQDWDGDIPF